MKETYSKKIKPKETLSVKEIAQRWNMTYKSVYSYFWDGKINKEDLIIFMGTTYVPIRVIEDLEKQKAENDEPMDLEKLLRKLEEGIRKSTARKKENEVIYLDYFYKKICRSTATIKVKLNKVRYYISTYKYVANIPKVIYKLTDKEVQMLLQNKEIPNQQKEILSAYIADCDQEYGIVRKKQVRVIRNSHNKSNEDPNNIYTFDIYEQYGKLVKDIVYLTPMAIKSQSIANYWLYIIMHLTNNWRGPDIERNIPNIELSELGINSLEWFETNNLSFEQALNVVNQVRIKVKNRIASNG